MNNPENISQQELLAREFERWQKEYYDDVYLLYEKRDESRLAISFNLWEDRFIKFLGEKLPRMVETYKTQTSQFIPLSFHGGSLQNFKSYKSDNVEAFLAQCIVDARKGNLDIYYIAPKKKRPRRIVSANKGPLLIRVLAFIFTTIPKVLGRLFFDIFGQGDKAAQSSTIIVGYLAIAIVVLFLLQIIDPNSIITAYRFFFPEPK